MPEEKEVEFKAEVRTWIRERALRDPSERDNWFGDLEHESLLSLSGSDDGIVTAEIPEPEEGQKLILKFDTKNDKVEIISVPKNDKKDDEEEDKDE